MPDTDSVILQQLWTAIEEIRGRSAANTTIVPEYDDTKDAASLRDAAAIVLKNLSE